MPALEPADGLVIATEHEGAGREQLGVRRGERRMFLGSRQRFICLEPCTLRVRPTPSLELVDSIPHPAAHCPTNPNATRGDAKLVTLASG